MRVQTENSNLWGIYAKIPAQGSGHKMQLTDNLFLSNKRRHIFQRHMSGHYTDFQTVTNHDHSHLVNTEFLFKIFSMAGISETLLDHRPFVDRSSHKNVDIAIADVLDSHLQGSHCRFSRFRGWLSRLYKHILWQAVDYINPFIVNILGWCYYICIYLVDVVDLFFIESENLWRTIYYRGADIEHPFISQSLDNHFISDAVPITLGYSYY